MTGFGQTNHWYVVEMGLGFPTQLGALTVTRFPTCGEVVVNVPFLTVTAREVLVDGIWETTRVDAVHRAMFPALFVCVTLARINLLRSVCVRTMELVWERFPKDVHSAGFDATTVRPDFVHVNHSYVTDDAGVPITSPGLAVIVSPKLGVPESVGETLNEGARYT
jgi:hypothetical protein